MEQSFLSIAALPARGLFPAPVVYRRDQRQLPLSYPDGNLNKNIAPLLPARPSHLVIDLFHAYPFCFYRSLSLPFVCPTEQTPSVLTGRGLLAASVLYRPVHYPADFRIKSVGILHTTRIPTA